MRLGIGDASATLIVALLVFGGGGCTTHLMVTDSQIREAVRQVQEQTDYEDTLDAAFELEDMTREGDLRAIGFKSIDDIASLLDGDQDAIRAAAARSLGNFGPQAERAVPKLLKALTRVFCDPNRFGLHWDSEISIRESLEKIGVTRISTPDCDKQRIDDQ